MSHLAVIALFCAITGPAMAQTSSAAAAKTIMANYELCLENASERTRAVKKEALRPKFFAAKIKACDRIRDAEISTAQANAEIATTREHRTELEAEMAAMTAALLADARQELGLSDSN